MFRVLSNVLLALTMCLSLATPAAAAEYFVDFDATPGIGCTDAGPGTDPRSGGMPWCTLPGTRLTSYYEGVLPGPWSRIHAGDVLSIKAGTTHTTAGGAGAVLIDHSHYDDGTAAARVVIRKHPSWGTGDHAAVDGTGMSARETGIVSDFGVDYLTLDGLEIANAPDVGIDVELDAHHLVIDHAYVHDGRGTTLVLLSGCTTNPCMQVVRNSVVANAGVGGGILVYDNPGGHVLIENNVVHHVCGGVPNLDGIQCGALDGTTDFCAIRGNLVYAHGTHSGYPECAATGSDPISAGGAGCHDNALVEDNEVRDSGGRLLVHGPYEDDCPDADAQNAFNIVRRNRLTNIDIITYGYPSDTIFYNNTLYNPARTNMVQIYSTEAEGGAGTSFGTPAHLARVQEIGRDTDFGRLTLKNNILWGQQSYHVLLNGVPGFRIDARYSSFRLYYNLYSAFVPLYWYPNETDGLERYGTAAAYLASRATDPPDVGSIFSNASLAQVFVDAPHGDFHLVPGSPAIDAGTAVTHALGASDGGAAGSVDLHVERASFVDGWSGLLEPDHITVGDCPDVAIVAIDDFAATIVLAAPCRWNDGDPVNLASQGAAPDLGAFEAAPSPPPSPTPVSTPIVAATATPTGCTTGAPCDDGDACTVGDLCAAGACVPGAPVRCGACETCDAKLGCVAMPRTSCRPSTAPAKSVLQFDAGRVPAFKWVWAKGRATTIAELGDPRAGATYALCVFDDSGVVFRARSRTGRCGKKACWKRPNASSFTYKDPERSPDGIDTILLKSGPDGRAKVSVTGKGPNVALPTLPLPLPLRVQLQADDGSCWESRHTAVGVLKNRGTHFKAKATPP